MRCLTVIANYTTAYHAVIFIVCRFTRSYFRKWWEQVLFGHVSHMGAATVLNMQLRTLRSMDHQMTGVSQARLYTCSWLG